MFCQDLINIVDNLTHILKDTNLERVVLEIMFGVKIIDDWEFDIRVKFLN